MIRYFFSMTAFSLILTAVLAQPGHANEPKKEGPAKVDEESLITVIKAELKKLENGLSKDIGGKIDAVKKSVRSLQSEIANLKAQQLELRNQLDSQKAQIDQLTEERKKLTVGSSPIEKRLSNYGPGATATSGRMMLVNLYSQDVLFTVNDIDHIVPAGRSKMLENVPLGAVNYAVFSGRHGFLDRQAITLLAGETFTLTVFPKR